MSQTFTILQKFVAERLQIEEAELRPDTTLESIGIDSLAQIEMLTDLQEVAALIDAAKTSPGDSVA
jgi:acyl carrier protein